MSATWLSKLMSMGSRVGLVRRLPGVRLVEPLAQLSLATKLYLAFGAQLLAMLVIGGMAWLISIDLARDFSKVVEVDHKRSEHAAAMRKGVSDMQVAVLSMSLTDDAEDQKFQISQLHKARTEYQAAVKLLQLSIQEDTSAAELKQALKVVEEVATGAGVPLEQLAQRVATGATRETVVDFAIGQLQRPQEDWSAAIEALQAAVGRSMVVAAEKSRASTTALRGSLLTVVLVALIAGVLIAWKLSRTVSTRLRQAATVSTRVADGDLAAPLPSPREDEIGILIEALRHMQLGLRRMVGEIQSVAGRIHAVSTEVANGNQDLSRRNVETVESLRDVTSTVSELSHTSQQMTDSTDVAGRLTQSAVETANQGEVVVVEVVDRMQEMAKSNRRIADIIGVVDGIAYQTNLLALNAAVEAARAGEAGRGFAVVAGEVRSLSHRTAIAAKEIKSLIEASVERVDLVKQRVGEAGESMKRINAAIQRVACATTEVNGMTMLQSDRIERIRLAVEQLGELTRSNSAIVEEGSESAGRLRGQAGQLQQVVSVFRTDGATEHATASITADAREAISLAEADLRELCDTVSQEYSRSGKDIPG